MVHSHIDSMIGIDKDNFAITLIDKGNHARKEQKNGRVGFLVLEYLNENNEHVCYSIGLPFGSSLDAEIIKLSLDHIEKIKTLFHSPHGIVIRTWSEKMKTITADSDMGQILELIKKNPNLKPSHPTNIPEYSYQKNLRLLKSVDIEVREDHFDPSMFPPAIEELFSNEGQKRQPIKWNPLARLIENKQFQSSRLIRSSIKTRIFDIFYLFNGSLGLENELGLFDYVFPFPRLFLNLLTIKMPSILKIILAIPTAILWAIKTTAAALITVPISLAAGLLHPFIKVDNATLDQSNKMQLKVIGIDLESMTDLDEKKDILKEATLSTYATIADHLVLKPLSKDADNHYHDITKERPYNNNETLVLGVFENKKTEVPKAIAEITPKNYPSIFAAMKMNLGHIDENMEEAKVMKEVLAVVTPK